MSSDAGLHPKTNNTQEKGDDTYSRLTNQMPAGYALHEIIYDDQGQPIDYRFLEINPAFERLTGLTAASILGHTVMEILPQTESIWLKKYGKVALTGESCQFEQFSQALNRHFHVTACRTSPHQFVCFFTDITDRKRFEDVLIKSEALFRGMFMDHSASMLLIAPNTGQIVKANQAAAQYYGYPLEDMSQMKIQQLNVLPLVEIIEKMGDAFQNQENFFEFKHVLADGQVRDVEVHSTPITIQNQILLFSIIHDITERKRAEEALLRSEALKRSEALLARSQMIAHVGSWELDLLSDQLTWSNETYRIFGLDPKVFDPSYEALFEAIHPADRAGVDAAYSSSLEDGADGYEIDHRIIRKDSGEIRIVHDECVHERNASGVVIRSFGNVQDITERRQVEEALRESEARWEFAVDGSAMGLWDWNIQTNKVFFSKQWKKMLGFEDHEISDTLEEWKKRVHPEDNAKIHEDMQKYLGGKTIHYKNEYRILCKDNSYKWILDRGIIVTWTDEGKPLRMIGTHSDITESKQSKIVLKDSHEQLLTVLDNIEAMVYVADMEDYTILFINKHGKELFGEVTGSICWQSLQKEQQGPCPFCANKYLLDKNGRPTGVHEREFQNTETGQWFHVLTRAIRWSSGKIVHLTIGTDMTKHKQLLDNLETKVRERTLDLQKTYEQLLHAEKMSSIGALSASIAHEFNNPLQGVMSIVQGIKKRTDLDPDDAELIDLAIMECKRMKELIRNLQDFNRPTASRKAPMDIHAALESILLLNKKELANREIAITKKYAENLPRIMAVSDQLKQVFLNLLTNASDAIDHGGNITIETDSVEDNLVIRFHDTGCGISSDDRKHIFEPFFTTKTEMKGTGLGLSVSYGIIKAHGGEITVESEPGKGSNVSIVLPIKGNSDEKK